MTHCFPEWALEAVLNKSAQGLYEHELPSIAELAVEGFLSTVSLAPLKVPCVFKAI